ERTAVVAGHAASFVIGKRDGAFRSGGRVAGVVAHLGAAADAVVVVFGAIPLGIGSLGHLAGDIIFVGDGLTHRTRFARHPVGFVEGEHVRIVVGIGQPDQVVAVVVVIGRGVVEGVGGGDHPL